MTHPHSDTDPGRTPAVDALTAIQTWNQWAPDALHSPTAPAAIVDAYNRWQPDHLKIRRA